jgi:hypothetical protein
MAQATTLGVAALCALALSAGVAAMGTELCFSKGEKIDGLNKICFYRCPSGDAAITVKSYELCPVNIKR